MPYSLTIKAVMTCRKLNHTSVMAAAFLYFLLLVMTAPIAFAQGDVSVSINMQPREFSAQAGEQKPFSITVASPDVEYGISGFDICLTYDPATLIISEIADPVDVSTGSSTKFQELRKEIDNTSGRTCFVYVSILPDEELARTIRVDATASAQGGGQGAITVDAVQIVGNIEGDEYEVDQSILTYTIYGQPYQSKTVTQTVPGDQGLVTRLILFFKQIFPFLN